MIRKTWHTVYLVRKLQFIGYGFVADATTIKVNMANIYYSSIAKVPSDLISVNIHSITAKYAIKTYAYAHSIEKVMFPELVIHEKTSNLPDWINRLRELERSLQKLGHDEILKESIRVMHICMVAQCLILTYHLPPYQILF